MSHLFVTNDFPPKIGGIQSVLWEWWRRLPPDRVTVLTTSYQGSAAFDATQSYRIERAGRVLLPTRALRARIDALAREVQATVVVLDPALPLGLLGPRLALPYAVVLHGAEVTVPGRIPAARQLLARVLRGARGVIAAGSYPAAEATRAARRALPVTQIPPGVDVERFEPLDPIARKEARTRFGLPVDAPVIVSVCRLVPRKGIDVLIDAAAQLRSSFPDLVVAIGGAGRDRARLDRRIERSGAPVRMLGRIDNADLPAFFGCADVFAQPCRNRWLGLEQEGFGIIFVEAAACGVPQVAGRSGGSHEAVVDGETGFVVGNPRDPSAVARAIETLLRDDEARVRMGEQARARAVAEFSYDVLVARLDAALVEMETA